MPLSRGNPEARGVHVVSPRVSSLIMRSFRASNGGKDDVTLNSHLIVWCLTRVIDHPGDWLHGNAQRQTCIMSADPTFCSIGIIARTA